MIQRKESLTRLLPLTSISVFGKEKELPIISTPLHLPRRRTSTFQVTFDEDSSDSEHHSPILRPCPSTSASSSAMLRRLTSRAGLRSLDTSSNSSLRSISKNPRICHRPPVLPKNSFRSKAPKPLKLDERVRTIHTEQVLNGRETTFPPNEDQFRRRRGDLLHRSGSSVPYMQSYGSTSLKFDDLTARLLEFVCEPGTPCFYKFKNRSAVTTVLDLGCGPHLSWVMTAARFWPNAKIIGVDCVRPGPDVELPNNVEFLQQNFLQGLPTIKTESIDFVRMSCLGTSIPEEEWPIVLAEVRRVLSTGGAVEIIDDELVRVYPEYPGRSSRLSAETGDQEDGLHPIDRYFKQMLVERYRMPKMPHRTIDIAMEIVFGANDKKHFRVELPSRSFKIVETEETRQGGNLFQALRGKRGVAVHDTSTKAQRVLGLDSVGGGVDDPFLIFYPHGLCNLDVSEVQMAACGSMHRVLSCRASLIDFIVGPAAEGEELNEVTNMLWEYEEFYRKLFDLPDDDWNEFCGKSGRETPPICRTSSDSQDSGYASQSSITFKVTKDKKASRSFTTDNNDSTLVRCFRIFHATKL